MKFITILILLATISSSCTTQLGNISFSDMDIFKSGDEIGTATTITTKQVNRMDTIGKKVLTAKEKKQAKKAFKEGMDMANKALKKERSYTGAKLHYVVDVPYMNDIDFFLSKNPKAKGLHPELILAGAMAYKLYNRWMVFEGPRSKTRAEKLRQQGRSWTKNSRHTWTPAMAMDILAKNKKGKFSFDELHILGVARGVIYAVYLDLKAKGQVCNELEYVETWTRVVDLYHVQINYVKECKLNPVVWEDVAPWKDTFREFEA